MLLSIDRRGTSSPRKPGVKIFVTRGQLAAGSWIGRSAGLEWRMAHIDIDPIAALARAYKGKKERPGLPSSLFEVAAPFLYFPIWAFHKSQMRGICFPGIDIVRKAE